MNELVLYLEKRADQLLRTMDSLEETCRTDKTLNESLKSDLKRSISRIYRQYCSINNLLAELSR